MILSILIFIGAMAGVALLAYLAGTWETHRYWAREFERNVEERRKIIEDLKLEHVLDSYGRSNHAR